jgi:hypothetical protein
MMAAVPDGEEILALVQQREEMLRDAWLTKIGHARPDMPRGLPFENARTRAAEIETRINALTIMPTGNFA